MTRCMVGVGPTRSLGGLPPGHWVVTLGEDWALAVAKRSWNQAPRLFQVLQPSLRYADLVLEARWACFPWGPWVGWIAPWPWLEGLLLLSIGPFQDLLRCRCMCLPPDPSASRPACGLQLEGLESSVGSFQHLWRVLRRLKTAGRQWLWGRRSYVQGLLVSWGMQMDPCDSKTMDYGWNGLLPNYRALIESTVWQSLGFGRPTFRCPISQPRGAETGSWAPSESTARTEVSQSITRCTGWAWFFPGSLCTLVTDP